MTSFILFLYISLLFPIIICSHNLAKSIKRQEGVVRTEYLAVFHRGIKTEKDDDPNHYSKDPVPMPTGNPTTSMPSSSPTTSMPSISHMPTYLPTPFPSSTPSVYVKTDFPTNSPSHPTSIPSIEQTFLPSFLPSLAPLTVSSSSPSSFPSNFTTSSPSSAPFSSPSSVPSFRPHPDTISPSHVPSFQPSQLPTPSGSLGKDWWYLLSTEVTVCATNKDVFSTYDIQEVIDSLQYSFVVEFSDILSLSETEEITVIVDEKKASSSVTSVTSQLRSESFSSLPGVPQSSENITSSFTVSTWCTTNDIGKKISEKLLLLHESPEPILL
jgi:hypothetical protein